MIFSAEKRIADNETGLKWAKLIFTSVMTLTMLFVQTSALAEDGRNLQQSQGQSPWL